MAETIIYNKRSTFSRFIALFIKKEKMTMVEINRKINKRTFYNTIVVEMNRINNLSKELYGCKLFEMDFLPPSRNVYFVKNQNLEIRETKDFFLLCLKPIVRMGVLS